MSTSNKPDGVSDVFANNRNVEMQIVRVRGNARWCPSAGAGSHRLPQCHAHQGRQLVRHRSGELDGSPDGHEWRDENGALVYLRGGEGFWLAPDGRRVFDPVGNPIE
ncbi:hypothetical protein [Hoyosella subflava]|uniref:hypothetical protein n=1 Tax=Hoyosella subflava TaxID=639313 RepID=UPI00059C0734|nr:hypothetical protein [Hoyosella subflava]